MRRILANLGLLLALASIASGQQASKHDVERVFQVMHLRDSMQIMMKTLAKQQSQMIHEQIEKTARTTKLPPDFESRMDNRMDDMLQNFPMEEILAAMTPVYQNHLTTVDVDAMVAFYSTPTGEKLIRDLPAITQEGMQAAYPILQKQMDATMERLRQELERMNKESKARPAPSSRSAQ